MKFQLTIDCENAAFIDNPSELADILRSLANKIEHRSAANLLNEAMPVRDSNGNKAGLATFAED